MTFAAMVSLMLGNTLNFKQYVAKGRVFVNKIDANSEMW